jgi:hypothetical protein
MIRRTLATTLNQRTMMLCREIGGVVEDGVVVEAADEGSQRHLTNHPTHLRHRIPHPPTIRQTGQQGQFAPCVWRIVKVLGSQWLDK